MKKYLTLALALTISTTGVFAATEFGNAFKSAVKSDVSAIKEAEKQDMKNQQSTAQKQREEQKKARKDAINQKRSEQIKPIEDQIKQKEQLIKDTKKDKTITETQRAIKLRNIERQLDALNAKKDAINKLYDSQLQAL